MYRYSKNLSNLPILINRSLFVQNNVLCRNQNQFKSQYVRFNSNLNKDDDKKSKNPAEVALPVKADESNKKLTIWEKVKHEAHHYWDGTKLLGLEIKISSRLLMKMTSGYELTRREYRQLQRTTADVLRLFPFAMFVLIPFAELLLPVALKLFPNLLPSTYESKLDKEKKMILLRNTRTKVSELLKNSKRMIKLPSTITEEQRKDFKDFISKLRSTTTSKEIERVQLLRVAKMFKDDLVLDNVPRGILIAMAKYINLKPYGTDQILRYRIRHKMLKIKADDKLIDYDGVETLSVPELQQACASRGIKIYDATVPQMRTWLQDWLDMRLRERIPSTLMILVNAYTYGDAEIYSSKHEALKAVLSSLPVEVYHEQELQVDQSNATFKQRMEVVKEQEHLIQNENVQEKDHVILVKDKLSLDDPTQTTNSEKTESTEKNSTEVKTEKK